MSFEPAIKVRHISKYYDLGVSGRTKSWATIARERARHPIRGGTKRERMYALEDLSFDVGKGEAVGLVGNNGAGKSTLLKILSRITPPSAGYVDILGNVGALLEIGTGFHPELTGMENIFLNGTILGMSKQQVVRSLDEIVAFADIDKFLDTPVKRYSSGMRVRLAFSVAAHLEPDILIVDEVLSVGDYSFQAKCLEKMRSVVTNDGRTVLFVSHNLATVEHFCPRSLVMANGHVTFDGPTDQAIKLYLQNFPQGEKGATAGIFDLSVGDRSQRGYSEVLKRLELRPSGGSPSDSIRMGERLRVEIEMEGPPFVEEPYVIVTVGSGTNMSLFRFSSGMVPFEIDQPRGECETIVLDIPSMPLTPGEYFLDVHLKDPVNTVDFVHRAATFTVLPADVFGSGYMFHPNDGYFTVPFDWQIRSRQASAT